MRISAAGLAKLYGSTVALAGVSVAFAGPGLSLVRGPNGSGKTTLLRILAGLTTPTAGKVTISSSTDVRPRLAFVGHAGHLYGELTALENLELAAHLAGRPATDALARLAELDLVAVAGQRCRRLSAGTQRRVALARGLVADPDVLFVDEPFAGVDDMAADLVADCLVEARREGRIVIVASHEMRRSKQVADRIIELVAGRLVGTTPSSPALVMLASELAP
ncbi:MAG: ATP-binding cassette domain-containing protein [Candidatus Limnocylindrales bacterium]